jgi:hypothetical protein
VEHLGLGVDLARGVLKVRDTSTQLRTERKRPWPGCDVVEEGMRVTALLKCRLAMTKQAATAKATERVPVPNASALHFI